MKITFPIFPIIKDGVIKFITDTQYFFKKEFITENYYKHLLCSILLIIPGIWFLTLYCYLGDTPVWFHFFLGGFGAMSVNWIREVYMEDQHEAPFSWTDINFGTYGGILGVLIFIIIK